MALSQRVERALSVGVHSRAGGATGSRVVIGIRDVAFHQEVLDWLDRDYHVELVGAASDPGRIVSLLTSDQADVVLLCPAMAKELAHPSARAQRPRTLVVAQEMTVPVLRDAIEAGAWGVFAWPDERAELASEISAAKTSGAIAGPRRAMIVAILGARGGAGVTFVATHLAAALAQRGVRCALVDLQAGFADLTAALGVRPDEQPRTVADLLPVMDELAASHVRSILHHHRAGFAALLAPSIGQLGRSIPHSLYEASIDCLASEFDVVLLQTPRAPSDEAAQTIARSDQVVMVLTLDLLSLVGAKRAKAALGLGQGGPPFHLVVNKRARSEITASDVESTLGEQVFAAIRFDRRAKRTQDRGQLLRIRTRGVTSDLRRLARALQGQPVGHNETSGD